MDKRHAFFFTTSLSSHVKVSIDRKTNKVLLSWDPGIKFIIPPRTLRIIKKTQNTGTAFFLIVLLGGFLAASIFRKLSICLQEHRDMMRVFLFCCFPVYVMKGKNFQISPTPVRFCLENELTRDSFMHYLPSFSERSTPWRIYNSSLFRSMSSCLHQLFY